MGHNGQPPQALFILGDIVATPGALAALHQHCAEGAAYGVKLLSRHVTGDWAELDPQDQQENCFSVAHGLRVFSSYTIAEGVKIWVITEADRSVTTLLLPSEY